MRDAAAEAVAGNEGEFVLLELQGTVIEVTPFADSHSARKRAAAAFYCDDGRASAWVR